MVAYTMLYTTRYYSLKALNMLILILPHTTSPILQEGNRKLKNSGVGTQPSQSGRIHACNLYGIGK